MDKQQDILQYIKPDENKDVHFKKESRHDVDDKELLRGSASTSQDSFLEEHFSEVNSSGAGQSSYDTKPVQSSESLLETDPIKDELPGLRRLVLPPTPEHPENSSMGETWEDGDDSQNDSDDSIRAEPESLPKVRPYPVFTRMKTRLQDPPSLSPAIKSQLTYCRSTSTHQNIITQCAEGETSEVDKDPCVGDPQGTDPALLNQTNNQLGHLPSNSKLKVGANDEEEKNVLDDDGYIAEKKAKENKGLLITQWCTLLFLITLLVCTNKIQKLEKVKIFGLNLWRWQALLLVIFCGHLISGWIMKALEVRAIITHPSLQGPARSSYLVLKGRICKCCLGIATLEADISCLLCASRCIFS